MPYRNREPMARSIGNCLLSFVPHPLGLERMVCRVLSSIQFGRVTLVLPDGRTLTFAGERMPDLHAVVRLQTWKAVQKLVTGGPVAFAEAYIDGLWESPDLGHFMRVALHNAPLVRWYGGWASHLCRRLRHMRNANTIGGSQRNISHHYDLGNAFYQQWLDASMTYSSGLYRHAEQSLEQAQAEKYERICRLADLQPNETVLEVGCGWGGFAEIAAGRYHCMVEGLTLSQEQYAHALHRMTTAGLQDRATIAFRDYRQQDGQYDKLVSIEMFEAVGEKHWSAYFDMVRNRLRPGGKAVLQIITIHPDRFESYRRGVDFIQRYIFPGGMLPSVPALERAIDMAGLRLSHAEFFAASYARTLAEWQRRFQQGWERIAKMGFDLRFKRMWEYYLSYCESGFLNGTIDVGLFVIDHGELSNRLSLV